MIELAIDSSTARLVVGIVADHGRVVAERLLEDERRHNEVLVPTVQECLAEAGLDFPDLDAVVCGCGPGPFTGLRVGMATAAAIADARGLPLRGVGSLDAIARDPRLAGQRSLVLSDARRREVYFAAYAADGTRLVGPEVARPAELPREDLEQLGLAVLSAPERIELPEWLAGLPRNACFPSAAGLAKAPEAPFAPVYLRRPDAVAPSVQVSSALRR